MHKIAPKIYEENISNMIKGVILITNVTRYRLEAKSEKGPRNHFRGDRMLEDVTHTSSPV